MTTETKIANPAELAAAYGLPWPADACRCCGGRIIDGRCLGADRCTDDPPAGHVFPRCGVSRIAEEPQS